MGSRWLGRARVCGPALGWSLSGQHDQQCLPWCLVVHLVWPGSWQLHFSGRVLFHHSEGHFSVLNLSASSPPLPEHWQLTKLHAIMQGDNGLVRQTSPEAATHCFRILRRRKGQLAMMRTCSSIKQYAVCWSHIGTAAIGQSTRSPSQGKTALSATFIWGGVHPLCPPPGHGLKNQLFWWERILSEIASLMSLKQGQAMPTESRTHLNLRPRHTNMQKPLNLNARSSSQEKLFTNVNTHFGIF